MLDTCLYLEAFFKIQAIFLLMDLPIGAYICQTIDCGKPATLQCPTCIKMALSPSYFCNQECFKRFWPIHKTFHKKQEENESDKNKFKFTGPLRPGKISPRLFVPDHIKKPEWYYTGIPAEEQKSKLQNVVDVKSPEDIQKMRECAAIGRGALDAGHQAVKAGVTTDEIDKIVHKYIIEHDAYPSPLNYNHFKKSLCTSVNEVICHGIPDDRPLENGDIVNLDVSVYFKGFHIDLNETYFVGDVSESSRFLVSKAYNCLQKAIEICKPGTMYREVGAVIEKYIHENGLAVNRTYCGHGIGQFFHCAPTSVPHYAKNKAPGYMKAGHTFTIEPMINQGTHQDILWTFDDWTAVTADGMRSAQFEHTLLITDTGVEILTARTAESPPLGL